MVEREYKKRNLIMKFLLLLIVRINILISKKGSEKGSASNDFPCNILKLTKRKNAWISVFLLCWFVLNAYLTSVNTTCLRSFGEYFFNWRRSGVLRLFLEVRYKRSPDSLCSSVIFTRMVSPFYYSADAALAILRPL